MAKCEIFPRSIIQYFYAIAGANIGYLSAVAADAVGGSGKVYAFELSQREFDCLEAMAKLNYELSIFCVQNGSSDNEAVLDMDVSSAFGWNACGPNFMQKMFFKRKKLSGLLGMMSLVRLKLANRIKLNL